MVEASQSFRTATISQRWAVGLLLMGALVYLVPFVDRGWVPLDEGMIGQTAERVLTGALPHVDYEEPYPGALSYFYAAVFRTFGIDVVHLRWTVFGGALAALGLVFIILRRYLRPQTAALGTWVALTWSFPNYFSSLPSWWLLLCALVCLWAFIRHLETGRLVFVVIAGLAVGLAFAIKQTGIYMLPPLLMALMICPRPTGLITARGRRVDTWVRSAVAGSAFALVILVMRSGIGSGELLYLVVPVGACCVMFALAPRWTDAPARLNWVAPAIAAAAAAVPLLVLLLPHIAAGTVGAFVNGVFILPQRRLEVTSLPMRPAPQIVAAVAAVLWVFWAPRSLRPGELRILSIARWIVAIGLPLLALRSQFIYTFIWEAVRGTAAMTPVIVFWLVLSDRVPSNRDRRILFAASGIAAFASIGQFPFAAPIYFLYVVPLAMIAGVIAVQSMRDIRRPGVSPAVVLVLLFALVCLNREYVWNVGWFHEAHDLSTPLELERADLEVADFEAAVYGRVVPLVQQRLGERGLVAGPDTPDIYFLTGQFSPSGQLFEFFSEKGEADQEHALARWTSADVIVLFHGQRFSLQLSDALVSRLRVEFPHGESVPPFEVRWR